MMIFVLVNLSEAARSPPRLAARRARELVVSLLPSANRKKNCI